MEHLINEILEDVIHIVPIGHHHLKRHYVYEVKTKSMICIVKIYGIHQRYECEVNALKLLKELDLPIPKLLAYGIVDTHEYIIMNRLDGIPLKQLNLSEQEQAAIFKSAGAYLKQIHELGTQLPYGRLVEGLQFKSFDAYFDYEVVRILNHLDRDDHPEQEMIEDGKALLKKWLPITQHQKGLCHLDFGPRNLLVKKENGCYKISGILDFEQCAIADVKREIALMYSKFKSPLVQKAFLRVMEELFKKTNGIYYSWGFRFVVGP